MIFGIIDSLKKMVKNYLIISNLKKDLSHAVQQLASTNSPEAFRYYISGNNYFAKGDYATAITWYLQALNIDSSFVTAATWISIAYLNRGLYDEGKKWCLKIYKKREQLPIQQKIWTNWIYAVYFKSLSEGIKYGRQLLEIDDQQPIVYYSIGYAYNNLYQYDKAIPEFEKALEIYNKWGTKPFWNANYIVLGLAYHRNHQNKKEKNLYKKAERDFPNSSYIIWWQAVLSLTEGDMVAANKYIEKYTLIRKENSVSEANIALGVAGIYSEAGTLDKAEKYYRQSLSLQPESPGRMNTLAYFLIDKNRNINEGLELADTLLKLRPENYNYLHTKGWGLYKQGKYNEALEVVQKSWDLRMKNAIYDHEAYLHLEEAKKVVAGQKNK